MKKVKAILWIIGGEFVVYFTLIFVMPILTDISGDVAQDVAWRPGIGNYFAGVEAVQYAPLLAYIIPFIVGLVALVLVLRSRD